MSDTSAPTPEEGLEITDTGLVHLRIDSVDYWLRRPKIGEMRIIEDAFVDASEMHLASAQRLASAISGAADDDPDVDGVADQVDGMIEATRDAATETDAVVHAVLEAWRLTVRTLERERRTLPDDDDDLPPWLANFTTSNAMRTGWRRLPWLAAPPT